MSPPRPDRQNDDSSTNVTGPPAAVRLLGPFVEGLSPVKAQALVIAHLDMLDCGARPTRVLAQLLCLPNLATAHPF
jgi:hypothetical protein